ncbi:MAG: hypothetical protein CSA75_02330 [Sorangium cellulosum]|nr:MAG: hypothetical protein CSA75_02330 [Sorangium cellulosum]
MVTGSGCVRGDLPLVLRRDCRVDRCGLPTLSVIVVSLRFCSVPQRTHPRETPGILAGSCVQPNRKNLIDSSELAAKTSGKAKVSDVEAVVRPVLEAHGLELFDLSFRVESGGWVLRVIIDTPEADNAVNGVTVSQCADVSRDLSTALDVQDPLPHAYSLEVSSPGVERPLRGRSDFIRFHGQPAKLSLREAMEGVGATIRGKLAGVDDEVVKVDAGQPELLSIPISAIKRANLVYEMPGQPKKGNSKKKRRSNKGRRD